MPPARIYSKAKDFDRAIADANTALRLGPESAEWSSLRGSIYEEKKDEVRAKQDFDRSRHLSLAALLRELDLPPADKQPKAAVDALEKRIKEQVKSLEYGDDIARGVVTMVHDWNLVALAQKLDEARDQHKRSKLSADQRANVEIKVADYLARIIEKQIWPTDPKDDSVGHELSDVVRDKKACCQGVALLYFVLGNAIGLPTEGLEVDLMADGPQPSGNGHDACLVQLANGTVVIADVTRNLGHNVLVSAPFRFDDIYRKYCSYWKLKDESNPLGLHRVVLPADLQCLIAQICTVRAQDCFQKGDRDSAFRKLADALRRNPRSAVEFEIQASLRAKCGDYERALTDFSEAISRDPIYAAAYAKRGACYDGCGKLDRALADFRTAQELNPKLSWLPALRGRIYLQQGQLDKALADFNKAVELDPKDSFGYASRAYIWSKKAQEEKGLADFAARWASAPPYGEASAAGGTAKAPTSSGGTGQTTAYGDGTVAGGNVVTADPWGRAAPTNAAAALATSYSDAFSWSGSSTSVFDSRSYSLPGSPDQAAAAEIQAMKEGSVRKYLQSFKEDLAKAVADYSEAIRLDPKIVDAYRSRGYLYAWDGKLDLAIADLTEAIRLDGKNIVLRQDRCKMYETKGDIDKAIADQSEIIRLDPKSVAAYEARAALYAKKHDTDKAAADLAEAERLHPSDDRYR